MNLDAAVAIGQEALIWLAGQPELSERLLALSGAAPGAVRARAADPEFLGFVLDFLLGADATVIAFAAAAGLRPEDVGRARARRCRAVPRRCGPEAPVRERIRGIVFDKDGTLFDFNATWSVLERRLHPRAGRRRRGAGRGAGGRAGDRPRHRPLREDEPDDRRHHGGRRPRGADRLPRDR